MVEKTATKIKGLWNQKAAIIKATDRASAMHNVVM